MILHIPTGKQFDSRLQAKNYFGAANYNYRVKNKEFTFHDQREIIICDRNDYNPDER